MIGLDRDAGARERTRARLAGESSPGSTLELVHAEFRALPAVLAARGLSHVDGVLADLGVSSWQLDDAERGFSFRKAGPLDMRMDRSIGRTLAEWLATISEPELASVIREFGEERHARRVAAAIVRAREAGRLGNTAELASVVRGAAGGGRWHRIDPATRTFQALRIWVNRELEDLDVFIAAASRLLREGARLIVITFHSLEDRIVKHAFRALAAGEGAVRVLTRKPLTPDDDEVARNPRARSAKLRAIERLA